LTTTLIRIEGKCCYTKLFMSILTKEDQMKLQEDLDKTFVWSKKWLLSFNLAKCKSLTISTREPKIETEYKLPSTNNTLHMLEKVDQEKDIGVIIDSHLTFENHISAVVNKANSTMGVIRRTYKSLDEECFLLLFKGLVRPVLEYAAPVWSPYRKKYVNKVEDVQRRATKQLTGMKDLSYDERLRKLNLPTLVYRRCRGDMIEAYKMLNNKYDSDLPPILQRAPTNRGTRGHSLKLNHQYSRLDTRKHFFALRICTLWNDLPEEAVKAKNIQSFERRLDNYWKNQNFKFDIEAAYVSRDNTVTSLYEGEELPIVA